MAQYSRYSTYIAPLTKTPKAKAYTMFFLSMFAVLFFGIFAIRPTLLTIVALQKDIRQAKEADVLLSQKINSLLKAQDLLDQYDNKSYLLDQALPATPNITALLSLLERQAQAAGIQLGSVQVRSVPLNGEESRSLASISATLAESDEIDDGAAQSGAKPSAPPSQLTEIKFLFSAIGTPTAVNDFLHRLATTRRVIIIESVHFTTKEGSQNATAEISAKSFQLNK